MTTTSLSAKIGELANRILSIEQRLTALEGDIGQQSRVDAGTGVQLGGKTGGTIRHLRAFPRTGDAADVFGPADADRKWSKKPRPLRSFPQADNIQRVFAVADAVADGCDTWDKLGARLTLAERATFTYIHAARWLKLIQPILGAGHSSTYTLTPTGARYAGLKDEAKRAVLRRRVVFKSKPVASLAEHFKLEPEAFRTAVLDAMEPIGRTSAASVHNYDQGGISIEDLTDALTEIGGTTGETSRRRAYAVRSWLKVV